jgi:type II secretory pathway pseudopilin PulG
MVKRGGLKKSAFLKDYKGQVWVETVIYLLIAFVMMGLVLSFIRPKIEELRDKTILEQSVEVLKEIDNSILTIGSAGNRRLVEVGIRKGSLIIDSENDEIIFEMDSRYVYTEPDKIIQIGNIEALTKANGRSNTVTLKRDFSSEYDLTYNGEQILKTLTKAPNPYKLFFTNNGISANKIAIDFSA